jgi:hypothetical protein
LANPFGLLFEELGRTVLLACYVPLTDRHTCVSNEHAQHAAPRPIARSTAAPAALALQVLVPERAAMPMPLQEQQAVYNRAVAGYRTTHMAAATESFAILPLTQMELRMSAAEVAAGRAHEVDTFLTEAAHLQGLEAVQVAFAQQETALRAAAVLARQQPRQQL